VASLRLQATLSVLVESPYLRHVLCGASQAVVDWPMKKAQAALATMSFGSKAPTALIRKDSVVGKSGFLAAADASSTSPPRIRSASCIAGKHLLLLICKARHLLALALLCLGDMESGAVRDIAALATGSKASTEASRVSLTRVKGIVSAAKCAVVNC